jgi:hypothetical protein
MPDRPTNQSGGINIDGSLNSQGDIVGRDKIIHNIIVVGRILDFARFEGLLPNASELPTFNSIAEAFEKTLNDRLGSDLTEAVATAGAILAPVLSQWLPKEFAAFDHRKVLTNIASPLVERLQQLNYWSVFTESIGSDRWRYSSLRPGHQVTDVQGIWLRSLQLLWKKYKANSDKQYGIARIHYWWEERWGGNSAECPAIVVKQNGQTTEAYDPYYNSLGLDDDFAGFGREEFRIFIVGLVIDMIRLASVAVDDLRFWKGVIDSMTHN